MNDHQSGTNKHVVLLCNHPKWVAPYSFATELARALARQSGQRTLLVNLGSGPQSAISSLDQISFSCDIPVNRSEPKLRSQFAQMLADWKSNFENVILNLIWQQATDSAEINIVENFRQFANWQGDLLGPGEEQPENTGPSSFVLQSAAGPTLSWLSGNRRLAFDVAEAESAYRSSQRPSARFLRTVESIARCIAGCQVGLALGGGAAWGWAHIGVISVLEEAGLPIDAVAGCSMGGVIGALYCAGYSVEEMTEIAAYWRKRTRRFVEWRFWRMSLLKDKQVRKVFRKYFDDRVVNQTEIPFWANAVDIQRGNECVIKSGSLVECLRASIAMPSLISPVERGSIILVDAGIMDPVPLPLTRKMGCNFSIGVNAIASLESQKIDSRYPFNAVDVMSRCISVMGHEITRARAAQTADIEFAPSFGDITFLEFSRALEIIECGRRATEKHLPAVQASYDRLKAHSLREKAA